MVTDITGGYGAGEDPLGNGMVTSKVTTLLYTTQPAVASLEVSYEIGLS